MDAAVDALRKFIATSQERAAAINNDVAVFDTFVAERGPSGPDVAARKELVMQFSVPSLCSYF